MLDGHNQKIVFVSFKKNSEYSLYREPWQSLSVCYHERDFTTDVPLGKVLYW